MTATPTLREALDDAIATIAAVRATAVTDEWAESAGHFYELCGETLARVAALSAQVPEGDLVERLNRLSKPEGLCPADMGCNCASICLCALIEEMAEACSEAADRFEALSRQAGPLDSPPSR